MQPRILNYYIIAPESAGAISTPGWKRSHLGVRLEKVPS